MIKLSSVAVAVLAGGQGSRIGGGKPLIALGGTTLIGRAYERATGWSPSAAIAIRSPEQLGSYHLPWVGDDAGIDGPLAGLAAALRWACNQDAQALLTIPCDMPFIPADLPLRLISGIGDSSASVASSGGRLHPVCALWRSTACDELKDYCASGRRSLKGFAEHLGYAEVAWPVVSHDPFFNINNLADLAEAERMLGF